MRSDVVSPTATLPRSRADGPGFVRAQRCLAAYESGTKVAHARTIFMSTLIVFSRMSGSA
jgi:hypothetical protein